MNVKLSTAFTLFRIEISSRTDAEMLRMHDLPPLCAAAPSDSGSRQIGRRQASHVASAMAANAHPLPVTEETLRTGRGGCEAIGSATSRDATGTLQEEA